MMTTTFMLTILALAACRGDPASTEPDAAYAPDAPLELDAAPPTSSHLPVVNPFDPTRAAAGKTFLEDAWPGRGLLPIAALDYLWVVWGTGPVDDATKWQQLDLRYGLFRAQGEPWPVGLQQVDTSNLTFDCRLCHASRGAQAGEVWMGVGNSRLDLERLYLDLVELSVVASSYGFGPITIPFDLTGASAAPGAVDGVGLGMRFAGTIDDLGQTFGYQQAPAWWTMRFKEPQYTDGAGKVDNWRTMMSTLFSFGLSQAEIMAHDASFEDLRHYLLSLEPPAWPFPAPAPASVDAGRTVFLDRCASCHGVYEGPSAAYPAHIVATEDIGTDPVREVGMNATQVGTLNTSWYGQPAPWSVTDGYLAPPLVGVWATAPYFHNGSVPDLTGVLDSTQRPARWRHADDRRYLPDRVGWAIETNGDPAAIYDTSLRGLANTGHTYGDDLTATERGALIDYLKTL